MTTYLPENAVPEMYYSHLSYINSNIYALYKDYTFGESYDVDGVDNSAYYGETVFKFIRDHLGYRFVLRDCDLSESVSQNGVLRVCTKIENTGFANPIMRQNAEIILEKDGNYIKTEVDANTNQWYSCSTNEKEFDLKLPGELEPGKWNVYLKISSGENSLGEMNVRSVQFANHDVWNSAIGANYLGSFSVTKADTIQTDNSFIRQMLSRMSRIQMEKCTRIKTFLSWMVLSAMTANTQRTICVPRMKMEVACISPIMTSTFMFLQI